MGNVVALKEFESLRKQSAAKPLLNAEASILIFTGIRYEYLRNELQERSGELGRETGRRTPKPRKRRPF